MHIKNCIKRKWSKCSNKKIETGMGHGATMCSTKETHFNYNGIDTLIVNWWEKLYIAKTNKK